MFRVNKGILPLQINNCFCVLPIVVLKFPTNPSVRKGTGTKFLGTLNFIWNASAVYQFVWLDVNQHESEILEIVSSNFGVAWIIDWYISTMWEGFTRIDIFRTYLQGYIINNRDENLKLTGKNRRFVFIGILHFVYWSRWMWTHCIYMNTTDVVCYLTVYFIDYEMKYFTKHIW